MGERLVSPLFRRRGGRRAPRPGPLLLALLPLAAGCRPAAPAPAPGLVRLLGQEPAAAPASLPLAAGLRIGAEPTELAVPRPGARRDRLLLRASGPAGSALMVGWRFAGEPEVPADRLQPVLLADGDSPRLYAVDLWDPEVGLSRSLAAVELVAEGGEVTVAEVALEAAAAPQRAVDRDGLIVPSLPGAARLTLPLPAGLAGTAELSVRFAVATPALAHLRQARFRLRVETARGSQVWLDERLSGERLGAGWQLAERPVEVPSGASRVAFETELEAADGSSLDPALALWGDPRLRLPSRRPRGPNLLIIAIDTLRADVLGAYGDGDGLSPAIDRLAAASYRFSDLTSPAPWTLPSFASLLTGLQPQTHGAGQRLGDDPLLRNDQLTRLDERFATLAEVLAGAGLETGGAFTIPFLGPTFGLHRGYDEYYRVAADARAGTAVDRAVSWLERHRRQRFFFFLHLSDPHTPYEPPEPFCRAVARRLEPGFPGVPCQATRSAVREEFPAARRPWVRALYRAEVAYADAQVGRLLRRLADLGLDGNTVVLLVSDHGEDLWERQEQERSLGYHDVADHGHTLYRELLHVPAILHVPGRQGGVYTGAAEMVDLFPTLLDLLGVAAPLNEGRDLMPALRGGAVREPLRLAGALLYGERRRSARRGPWKLIWRPGEAAAAELYDLASDPGERVDLAGGEAEVVAGLRRLAATELTRRQGLRRFLLGSEEVVLTARLRPEQLERLRALGYLQ
jgi:arylsulfatase A-like enzyme